MYGVLDDDLVHEQVAALPTEALPGYAEARTLLEIAPGLAVRTARRTRTGRCGRWSSAVLER